MMKKYFLCLFFAILLASGSLWACADVLIVGDEHEDKILRDIIPMLEKQLGDRISKELAPSFRDTLSKAIYMAYYAGVRKVPAEYIFLSIVTSGANPLPTILNELNILKTIMSFFLSKIKSTNKSNKPLAFFRIENPTSDEHGFMYDQSTIALFERAVQERDKEIKYRQSLGDTSFSSPILEKHFFLAGLVDSSMSRFLSELLNKPQIKIKEDFFYKIEEKWTPYFQEMRKKAIELILETGSLQNTADILKINLDTLLHWIKVEIKNLSPAMSSDVIQAIDLEIKKYEKSKEMEET